MSANQQIEFEMPMPDSEIIFGKRARDKYVHIYVHLYVCQKLFSKTQFINLALVLESHFFLMALIAFCKRALPMIFVEAKPGI